MVYKSLSVIGIKHIGLRYSPGPAARGETAALGTTSGLEQREFLLPLRLQDRFVAQMQLTAAKAQSTDRDEDPVSKSNRSEKPTPTLCTNSSPPSLLAFCSGMRRSKPMSEEALGCLITDGAGISAVMMAGS